MAENLTPEQVRAAKLAAMPAPLGELHHTLYNEMAWLHLKWQDFRALFADSKQTVELLNQTAPTFFHHLHRALWEDMLLHLCRLIDPPQSAGHANLTLMRLPGMIPDRKLRRQAASLVRIADQKTKFARDWRNRRLAHKELVGVGGQRSQPLATASRQHVEQALAALRTLMNTIEQHYTGSEVAYEDSIADLSGVDSLLLYLRKGLDAQRQERQRRSSPGR